MMITKTMSMMTMMMMRRIMTLGSLSKDDGSGNDNNDLIG